MSLPDTGVLCIGNRLVLDTLERTRSRLGFSVLANTNTNSQRTTTPYAKHEQIAV